MARKAPGLKFEQFLRYFDSMTGDIYNGCSKLYVDFDDHCTQASGSKQEHGWLLCNYLR